MADGDPSSAVQVETPPAPLGPFNLPLLKIIMTGQGLHGLRYGDYQRYRQYCARKLQRLRKGLNFVHWEQGKGKSKFVQRAITAETVVDERFLQVVLYKAERCWAYAMQLRRDDPGREVHHMSRLLSKAVKHAAHLEALVRETADDSSKLEAEAYAAFLAGALYVQQEKSWDIALQKLTRCRAVYDEMLHHASSLAEREIYQKRVEELDPLIRYCRYNVTKEGGGANMEAELMEIQHQAGGAGGDMLRGMLEKSLADTRLKQASGHTVQWLGHKVSIENPTTHQHILSAEALRADLEKLQTLEEKIAAYDKVLMAYEDAKAQIRDDISKALRGGSDASAALGCGSDASAALIAALQVVRNFIEAAVLHGKRERDLLLVEQLQLKLPTDTSSAKADKMQARKAARPEDIVAMFDTLLSATDLLANIPGVKEDAGMAKLCAARTLLFKALRVVYLGQGYLVLRQCAQGYALFARALQLEKVARQRMLESAAHDSVDDVWLGRLATLARTGMVEALAQQALFDRGGSAGAAAATQDSSMLKQLASTPLSTRLNNYDAAVFGDGRAPKLVDFPPPIEAVACKPVLFDLALNKAVYPDLTARCTKKKAGAGIMSWFGRK